MDDSDDKASRSDAERGTASFSTVVIYWVLIVVSVLLVLLVLAAVALRQFIVGKIGPATMADIERMETTIVTLPRDWHKPADLPSTEVLKFHRKFSSDMERLRSRHQSLLFGDDSSTGVIETFYQTKQLTDAQRTSFSVFMAELQPLIDETSAVVRMPGYTMEPDYILVHINYLENQTFAKLMQIVASEQARQGECEKAFESALLPLRILKRPEQSYNITHMIAVAIASITAESFYHITEICGGEPAALEDAIRQLNDLQNDVFPGDISEWYNEYMAALVFAAAYGYPVDLRPQPQADIIRQYAELLSLPYYEWLIARFPSTDPRAAAARQWVAEYNSRMASSSWLNRWTNPTIMSPQQLKIWRMVVGMDPTLLNYSMTGYNTEEASTRAYVASAEYDLARLAIATRLGGAPATTETTWLKSAPVDPFTSGTYMFAPALNRHYSAGPDLDDDKVTVEYDVTNGTVSDGDLWIGR